MNGQNLRGSVGDRSTAQMFAVVVGVILIVAGIASLIVNLSFATGGTIVTEGLLFMDVNGWSGLLMLLTGVALIASSRSDVAARRASLVIGVLYLIVTVWSLFRSSVAGMLPVNDLTAILYAALGVLGVTAGVAPDPIAAERSGNRPPGA